MISSLLHLVGLRPRVYYTLTNFRGGGPRPPWPPPPQYANDVDPVYMKDVDVNDIEGNIILKTCYSVHKQFPGEIHGAQNPVKSGVRDSYGKCTSCRCGKFMGKV